MKSTLNRTKRALTNEKIEAPVSTFAPIPRTHTVHFSAPVEIPKENMRVPSPPMNTPESDDAIFDSMMIRIG